MKKKDFASLLRRGAAAIETPDDLTPEELKHVAIDLCAAADNVEQDHLPFESTGFNSFEQFIDVYTGRRTYNDDTEWVTNMDALLKSACDRIGHAFTPQAESNGMFTSLEEGMSGMLPPVDNSYVVAADDPARQSEVPADVWSEDTKYPRSDWKHEVAEGNTNLGYWDWVTHAKEADQPHGSQCVKCGRETTVGTTIGNLSTAHDLGVAIGDFVCKDCDQ
jgi:hypothetical protein